MSQYQPPQQPPQPPAPQPSPFGPPPQQGYAPPPGQPQPPFGQASFGQQQGGFPQQPYQAAPSGPGLFDTSFAQPTTPKVAKLAFVSIIVVAAGLVLMGLFGAIASFSAAGIGGAGVVLAGVAQLVLFPALGFAVLTLGRLLVEYFVETHKARQAAASDGD